MEAIANIIIGAFLVFSIVFLVKRNKAQKISIRDWIFSISAIILLPFGFAWLVTSIGEGEPQAGWLGMLVFSGLGVVLAFIVKPSLFPNVESESTKTKHENIGLKSTAALLLIIGALTLPFTIISSKLVSELSKKETINELLTTNILSDQELPKVIKTGIRYQNFYADFPEELETMVIQCMILGVENEEIVKLLSMILPENERFELYEGISGEISTWLESEEAYPSFEVNPNTYKNRVLENSEHIMRWIYTNFELPPLDNEKIELFAANEYSNNLDDYLGTPPEYLKEEIIIHAAGALRNKINETEVPANMDVFSELKESISEQELASKKHSLMNTSTFLKYLWIIPVLLLIAGFVIAFFAKVNLLKWTGFVVFLTGIFSLFYSNQLLDTDIIMNLIVENAPVPAMALAYHLIPVLIVPLGESLLVLAISFLVIGGALLLIAYLKTIITYCKSIILLMQGITPSGSKASLAKE